jgi:drug/metabolite transporter (DMT)-like permease
VAIAFALLTAAAWGVLEMLLLRAAKRTTAVVLGFWMSVLGGALTLPLALAFEPAPDLGGWAFAMVPGVLAVIGSLLYWQALRVGKLSVVSPTVATNGGIAALIAVLLLGERFTTLQFVALGAAVAGVVLASAGRGWSATGVGWAVPSAIVLGFYTVGLALSVDEVGVVWAVMAYRVAGVAILGAIVLWRRTPLRLDLGIRRAVGYSAVLDTVGFVSLTFAFSIGSIAIVSVVMAQFSTVAVVLAATVLHDRLLPHQWAGVVLVLLATATLSAMQ